MTKLCLINVVDPNSKIERHMPHLGLGYIASYLRKYSHVNKIKIIDDNIIENICSYKPDVVGISSVSQNINRTINLAEEMKSKFDIPIIVGGIHISALPHTLQDCFDIAVIGEGEQTMLELLEMFGKNGLDKAKLEKIKGIAFKDQNKIKITEKREMIKSLDDIPFPARDLLNIKNHTSMFTSRGCPYNCVFCSSSAYWENTRFFSAEYVVEEIKELIEKYNVTMIDFWDDLFIANKKRLIQISKLLKEEDIIDKVSFNCQARANLIDDDILTHLKFMNVNQLSFGFESGSQTILSYLKKNTVTVEQNRNAIFLSKKYGFKVNGSFVIGSPDESTYDINESLKFLKNSYIDSGSIFVLTPYPGTELWNYAKQMGIVNDNMDWNKLNQKSEIIEDFKFAKINPEKNYIYLNKNVPLEEFSDLYISFQKEFEARETNLTNIVQLNHLSTEVAQLQDVVQQMQNQATTDETEIIKLQDVVQQMQNQATTNETEIIKLQDVVQQMQNQATTDETEIIKLQDVVQQMQNQATTDETEIIKLQDVVQQMQNQATTNETEIIKLQDVVQQMQNQATTDETEIIKLQDVVQQMQNQATTNETEIIKLLKFRDKIKKSKFYNFISKF